MSAQGDSGWFPYLFPFLIVGILILNMFLDAQLAGWRALAKRFRAKVRPTGPGVLKLGRSVGGPHLLTASPAGLFVEQEWPIRCFHPSLLVPWGEIEYHDGGKYLWWRYHAIYLAREINIQIWDKQYRKMKTFLADRAG
jgi:hypothetical protein